MFLLALAVRLAYLYESAENPTFESPVVDAYTYDRMARDLAAGQGFDDRFFWQPFLYPTFLGTVYAVTGGSMVWAKIVQAVIGAITCALTFRLGRKAFGWPVGVIAAVAVAFYGPLIFFEGELVAAGLAAFWSVAMVLLFLRTAERKTLPAGLVLGLAAAAAVLTRPTFLPFVAAGAIWLALVMIRNADRRRTAAVLLAGAGGFAVGSVPVALLDRQATGKFAVLPASGGINLYIGNNPDVCRTLNVRPGQSWDDLVGLPARHGAVGLWEEQRFFNRQVLDFATEQPAAFLSGLWEKGLRFVTSRELPRNVDLYLYRRWSALLSGLAWKVGEFGFPFGLLLPMAAIGAALYGRRIPGPVVLFVVLYPLAVVAVFVTARYRVPVVPVLAVLAGAGVVGLVEAIQRRRIRRLMAVVGLALVIVVAGVAAGPFCEERLDYEAELHFALAHHAVDRDQLDLAVEEFARTAELRPDLPDAYFGRAFVLARQGKTAEAIADYRVALELKPDYSEAHFNLGLVQAELGEFEAAREHYEEALRLVPSHHRARVNLAVVLGRLGLITDALEQAKRAVQIKGDYPEAHLHLGHLLVETGEVDEAAGHYREALRLCPDNTEAASRLGLLLYKQQQYDQAAELFGRSLEIDPNQPEVHALLADVLAVRGQPESAAEHYRLAVEGNPELASAHYRLGQVLERLGQMNAAATAYRQAVALKPDQPEMLNALAWLLATVPAISAPAEAVDLARKAHALTDGSDPAVLDTLAAALAAAGQFDEARELVSRAIVLCRREGRQAVLGELQGRLDLYTAGQPYVQQP